MKVLIYDIETSPNIVYSWAVGRKISLTPDNIIQERQIICIAWKWLDEKRVHTVDWGAKTDDKQLLKDFSQVINEADVAIAHNGDRYDIKFINSRLAYHDLPPLKDITTLDTLKLSRKVFFNNSHKLDYLGQYLVGDRKLETGGFSLWKKVMDGDKKALTRMLRYCKQDVKLLEEVYLKIRKYAPQSVNFSILEHGNKSGCKNCGSQNVVRDGHRLKTTIIYQCYKCKDCGHFYRSNERIKHE